MNPRSSGQFWAFLAAVFRPDRDLRQNWRRRPQPGSGHLSVDPRGGGPGSHPVHNRRAQTSRTTAAAQRPLPDPLQEGTGASWIAYFRGLKRGDASRVAPIDKLSVALVAILGVLLLGKRLSLMHWNGISPISLGAILVGFG